MQTIKTFATDKTEGVIVVPNWPNQMWFPLIFEMIISVPILLTSRKLLLTLPGYEEEVCQPIWRNLDVLVCHISGKQYHVRNVQRNLLKSSCSRGEVVPHLLTTNTSKDSSSFVMKGVSLPIQAFVASGIEFLTQYFNSGVGYSAVNSERCALSTIISTRSNLTFGKLPIASRFLRGMFNIRPSLPKYVVTLDVNIVFNYIKSLPPLEQCSLKILSHRLVILLALTITKRDQTLPYLYLDYMVEKNSEILGLVNNTLPLSN